MTGIVPTLFGFPGTLAHGARQVQSWGRSTAGTQPDIGSPGRQTGTGRLPMYLVASRVVYHFGVDEARDNNSKRPEPRQGSSPDSD